MLTPGAVAAMLWAMFQLAAERTRAMWVAMTLAGVCYYGGWWLPWPLLGPHTPTLVAELDHDCGRRRLRSRRRSVSSTFHVSLDGRRISVASATWPSALPRPDKPSAGV